MTHSLPQARVIKRLAALIYDTLVVLAISFVYGWTVLMLKYKFFKFVLPESGRAEMSGTELFILLLLIIGFYSFFWRRAGQTLGMKAWRIQLLDSNGSQASVGKCIFRCLLAPVSLTIGYFWVLVDRDSKCLQDRLSGTQVIEVAKKPIANS